MKTILVDLNIILDFLNKRHFHQEAAQLINMCVEKKLVGFICAHEVTTLSYFLLKEQKDKTKVMKPPRSKLRGIQRSYFHIRYRVMAVVHTTSPY